MKYFIVAGEQSGDLHGSNLIAELRKKDEACEIRCWGGDMMEAAGARLMMHYKSIAYMGFVEVAKNLGSISRNLLLCREQIKEFNPDVVILIDYPGFNFRIARFAHTKGFRVFYYISPKIWAWNERRVELVRKYVDRMYIIFPFEVEFYRKHGIEVEYRGNPLLDETEKKLRSLPPAQEIRSSLGIGDGPVIALLAGSRKSEVRRVLPKMLGMVEHFPDHQFVVAGVRNLPDDLYRAVIGNARVRLIKDRTYEILSVSDAALVTSGTATLETALFGIPQVVCYRGDFVSMLIAWMVIKVKYISLVNLIAGSGVVCELVQYSLNERNLCRELSSILPGGKNRLKMIEDYRRLRDILGPEGASGRVAEDMIKQCKNPSG
jgi:lipid-A-disaccharide synthase